MLFKVLFLALLKAFLAQEKMLKIVLMKVRKSKGRNKENPEKENKTTREVWSGKRDILGSWNNLEGDRGDLVQKT